VCPFVPPENIFQAPARSPPPNGLLGPYDLGPVSSLTSSPSLTLQSLYQATKPTSCPLALPGTLLPQDIGHSLSQKALLPDVPLAHYLISQGL
jgi:hypothetical protein